MDSGFRGNISMKRLNSVSVPEDDQLTLTWDNVIVKYHPRLTIWDKLINKTPGQPKTLLRGGKQDPLKGSVC